jgi:hypothetical protein
MHKKPVFAPKFGLKQVGCHVVYLSQKLSQGARINFICAFETLHFHFCEVRGVGACKVWKVTILWLFELYVYVFVQPMSFCFLKELCVHMFMWGQRESKGGVRGRQLESMLRACKEQMHLELICFATQFFKKFQLWNCKLQMVVVLMCCFYHVQLPLTIFIVVLAFLFLIFLNW